MASANTRPDAIYPEMRVQQGQVNADVAAVVLGCRGKGRLLVLRSQVRHNRITGYEICHS
jgi:hypothetical protein